MKILHVISSLDPASGGPPRIALRLAAASAQLEHNVTILSYDTPSARTQIEQEIAEVPGASLLRRITLPAPDRFERLFALRAGKELNKVVANFDMIHVHNIWDSINRQAFTVARKQGVPYAILANGMLDPWSLQQKSWKKRLALSLGIRQMLNRAAFLHVGNLDEKIGVERLGLLAPVEIIPNGINPQEFDPLPEQGQFYAAHPELNGQPFVLFLSRLHYKKGLDYLAAAYVKIAPHHPMVHLVVAGPDDGARESFEREIHAAGLRERVHVVGPIYGRERFHILRDAACFCLPSRQEGFSIAILEAMACGTPVVISQNCHFPEVAESGAGEVVPLEVPAIASALDRVLSDGALRARMGTAGQALVHRQYTWPQVARQTLAAYERALK